MLDTQVVALEVYPGKGKEAEEKRRRMSAGEWRPVGVPVYKRADEDPFFSTPNPKKSENEFEFDLRTIDLGSPIDFDSNSGSPEGSPPRLPRGDASEVRDSILDAELETSIMSEDGSNKNILDEFKKKLDGTFNIDEQKIDKQQIDKQEIDKQEIDKLFENSDDDFELDVVINMHQRVENNIETHSGKWHKIKDFEVESLVNAIQENKNEVIKLLQENERGIVIKHFNNSIFVWYVPLKNNDPNNGGKITLLKLAIKEDEMHLEEFFTSDQHMNESITENEKRLNESSIETAMKLVHAISKANGHDSIIFNDTWQHTWNHDVEHSDLKPLTSVDIIFWACLYDYLTWDLEADFREIFKMGTNEKENKVKDKNELVKIKDNLLAAYKTRDKQQIRIRFHTTFDVLEIDEKNMSKLISRKRLPNLRFLNLVYEILYPNNDTAPIGGMPPAVTPDFTFKMIKCRNFLKRYATSKEKQNEIKKFGFFGFYDGGTLSYEPNESTLRMTFKDDPRTAISFVHARR